MRAKPTLWLAGVSVALMMPVAGLRVWVALVKNNADWGTVLTWGFLWILLPVWIGGSLVATYHAYPIVLWLLWRYLLLIEALTGLRMGSWLGAHLVKDSFLSRARIGGTHAWLHRRVVARHGTGTANGNA